MKKLFIFTCLGIIFITFNTMAKFNPPENYIPRSTRSAMMEFYKLDVDKDGKLSPEEYRGKLNRKRTRPEEKAIRKAKKKGTYKSPDEQFAIMDEKETGFITLEQFVKFYTDMESQERGKGKYY